VTLNSDRVTLNSDRLALVLNNPLSGQICGEGASLYDNIGHQALMSDRSDLSSVSQRPFMNYQGSTVQGQGHCMDIKSTQVPFRDLSINPASFLPEYTQKEIELAREVTSTSSAVKPTLMTPADFVSKSKTQVAQDTFTSRAGEETPRSVISNYTYAHSECISGVTTPRIVCDNASHQHPLTETFSFQISDYKEEITPRSCVDSVISRDRVASHGYHTNNSSQIKSSKQDIQKEIISIRNKLKEFEKKKKKLR